MAQTAAEILRQQQLQHAGDQRVATPAGPPPNPGISAEIQRQQLEHQRRPPVPAAIATPAPARVEQLPNRGPSQADLAHQQDLRHQQELLLQQEQAARARKPPAELPAAKPAVVDTHQGRVQPGALPVPGALNVREHDPRNPAGTVVGTPLPGHDAGRQRLPVVAAPIAGTTELPNGQQHRRQPEQGLPQPVAPLGRPPMPINGGEFQQGGDWRGRHHQGWEQGRQTQWAPIQLFRQEGQPWGWQNRDVYQRGWDSRFFEQGDPNCERLRPSINQEADSVAYALNSGDTQGGANQLNRDLWAMRGDLYAQNELLHEIRQEITGDASTLYLGDWDPVKGSWDTIEAVSPNVPEGYRPYPSYFLQTFPNPPSDY